MQVKYYGDRPRGTPPSGELKTQEWYPNIAILDISNAISRKRCKIEAKLVLITNRKSHMSFRLVPNSVTLDDLERRNSPNRRVISLNSIAFWTDCVKVTHNRVDLWRNLCTSLVYFVVRVRCRRNESSRSLSHLLMSFLS